MDLNTNTNGLSAYGVAVQNGFKGTEKEWLQSLEGNSAYELAVQNGYVGTLSSWLSSLRAKSDYQLAQDKGYTGSEEQWLQSLIGKSAYDVAVQAGYTGTPQAWLNSLKGPSAYQLALQDGFKGDFSNWLSSLVGKSAYEIAVENGFKGPEALWLNTLKGNDAYTVALTKGFKGSEEEWLASLNGASSYTLAKRNGFEGTVQEWLQSLKGSNGLSAYELDVARGYTGSLSDWLDDIASSKKFSEESLLYRDMTKSIYLETLEELLKNTEYRVELESIKEAVSSLEQSAKLYKEQAYFYKNETYNYKEDVRKELVTLEGKIEAVKEDLLLSLAEKTLNTSQVISNHTTQDAVNNSINQSISVLNSALSEKVDSDLFAQYFKNTNEALSLKAGQKYVDQLVINAVSGFRNFRTEALLLKSIPTEPPFFAKALDTQTVWEWVSNKWVLTGFTEKDLANKYTDESLKNYKESLPQLTVNKKSLEDGDSFLKNNTLSFVEKRLDRLYRNNRTTFSTVTSVYSFLDNLVSENPEYISRQVVANYNDRDIYSYTFKPPVFQRQESTDWADQEAKPIKAVIMGGVHGNEKEGLIAILSMFYEITVNWKKSDKRSLLRYSTEFVYIPILNVGGYNKDSRENLNGIDLNRNAYSSNPQAETVLANSLPTLYPDADFFVDVHDMYSLGTNKRAFWISTPVEETKDIALEIAFENSRLSRRDFDLFVNNEPNTRFGKNIATSYVEHWVKEDGVKGFLLEVCREGSTDILSLVDRRTHNQFLIENAIYKLVTYFSDLRKYGFNQLSSKLSENTSYLSKSIGVLSNSVQSALQVQLDFYQGGFPDFIQITEDGFVIEYSTDDVEALAKQVEDNSSLLEEISSDLTLKVKYVEDKQGSLNNTLNTKLDIILDFYTYDENPDFITVNEENYIILKSDSAIRVSADPVYSLDFFTYIDNPSLLIINDKSEILTEETPFLYDFYTYELQPFLVRVDTSLGLLDNLSNDQESVETPGLTSLPNNEAEADPLYFKNLTLKTTFNKYHPMYNLGNNDVIPVSNFKAVYEFYDKLMEENPNYITRTQFGESTLGNPQYLYKFAAPPRRIGNGSTQESIRPPRIMLNCGIHGSEKYGIIATMCFAHNLVNHWRDLEFYDELRLHCDIYIAPLMSPDGTKSITRTNANGVDLNRNFDEKWSTAGSAVVGSDNYRGMEPFSEVEARNYRDLVLSTEMDDYIDIHHGGEKEILWMASNNENNMRLLSNVATDIITYFHKNINNTVSPDTRLVYLPKNGDGTACGWVCAQGKSGFLFEGVGYSNENLKTLFNARKFNEWALTRLIYAAFKRTKNKQELNLN